MSTDPTDPTETPQPTLAGLMRQAGQALDDISSASEQYRQARVLYAGLAEGSAQADGVLFYQPTEGHPIQLPPPNSELLAELLETAAEKLRNAVRKHWQILQMSAADALSILDAATAADQAAVAAQFAESEQPQLQALPTQT